MNDSKNLSATIMSITDKIKVPVEVPVSELKDGGSVIKKLVCNG